MELKRLVEELNLVALSAGFENVLNNDSLQITTENARTVLMTYFNKLHLEKMAKNKEEGEKFLEENKKKEGVITLDGRQCITHMNQVMLDLMELKTTPYGVSLLEVFRVPGLNEVVDQAYHGKTATGEFELIQERNRYFLIRATPQRLTEGIVVVIHEVTDLRRLQTIRQAKQLS